MFSKATIRQLRLQNQLLTQPSKGKPQDVVRHLVAVQSQDYFGALWAVGQRMQVSSLEIVEGAFNEGRIVRTHVMRPTWHFVAAEDLRWLLELTAPRVHAMNAHMYRQNKLDEKTFKSSEKIMRKVLAGGKTLARKELGDHLVRAKMKFSNLSLAYIVMHAELDGLICSGPRRGKQFTYALLEERVPKQGHAMSREEALAKFLLRFFNARGPATAQDFSYWSGLTVADANRGIEMIKDQLDFFQQDDITYWFREDKELSVKKANAAYLLPNYDEFGMSYRDHGISLNEEQRAQMMDYSYSHLIVINGQLLGSWRRGITNKGIEIELWPFNPISAAQRKLIEKAARKYQDFLQQPVRIINWEESSRG